MIYITFSNLDFGNVIKEKIQKEDLIKKKRKINNYTSSSTVLLFLLIFSLAFRLSAVQPSQQFDHTYFKHSEGLKVR